MISVYAGLSERMFRAILELLRRVSANRFCGERREGETVDFLSAFLSG